MLWESYLDMSCRVITKVLEIIFDYKFVIIIILWAQFFQIFFVIS